uniref:Uncharacterized protein n=1 Tax=Arundo donax TaxID=35708 RepID=A0A0A9GR42_ARUDO
MSQGLISFFFCVPRFLHSFVVLLDISFSAY